MAYKKETRGHLHDPSQLRRMSPMNSALTGMRKSWNIRKISLKLFVVFQKATEEYLDSSSIYTHKAMKIYVRLMFLRIGEIDTLNEKYQAQASIESRWPIELDKSLPKLSSDEQNRLAYGKSVSLVKYSESNWHPQLYIENALGDLKEQIRYSAKKSKIDNQIYVCEHRDIKGLFWEKLELQHFPSDVQDLSISIASMLYDDKLVLMADPYHPSGINREAFVDQQEWSLYEHVDTQQRYIKEFLFRGEEEEEDNDEDDTSSSTTNKQRNRSILTVTCHAGLFFLFKIKINYWILFILKLVDQIISIGMDIVLYS
jgi:hypothetical protein